MFVSNQDNKSANILKKSKKGKYDNYSMKTYIIRDLETVAAEIEPSPTVSSDYWSICILLLLYTIQG